jgi:hypothetical protein
VIILGMMQVSKRIPFDDPQTLLLVRAGYILSNVIIIAIYAFVHFKINKKKGMTPLISWRGTVTMDYALTCTYRPYNPKIRRAAPDGFC